MWEADARGWKAAAGAPVPFITAGIDVLFLRPAPLAREVELTARAEQIAEDEIVVVAELLAEEKVRAHRPCQLEALPAPLRTAATVVAPGAGPSGRCSPGL